MSATTRRKKGKGGAAGLTLSSMRIIRIRGGAAVLSLAAGALAMLLLAGG
ncbi:hypothetical protein [Pusillimonas noertemannii]|nr:hypothetical protein [Pusillimonas noertemannii]